MDNSERILDVINIYTKELKQAISSINKETFSTIDIIKEYQGDYCKNQNAKDKKLHISFNQQFGKILSKNAAVLGIEVIKENFHDYEYDTTTALWKKTIG